ncbi:MFS transporter [Pseudovibrio sp. SPO723]|uniref:MFS transporter n=1 Tax=Nesiotobacter zosterae TaxID=392721 RepID=UPI0029C193DD|nr:MFS transporter [Pseudovibrio sp. SPO723]MDX5593857.1 MFS transporter [Pseudovibrio sp. SPO723]
MSCETAGTCTGSAMENVPARQGMSLPIVVYVLGLTIFVLTTSEFMVAGMMPSLSAAFGVGLGDVGYLISLYAAGMVVGGPVLTAVLLRLRVPNKRALISLLGLYVAGGTIAATAADYEIMAFARVVTGVAGSACFGVSLTICAELVAPDARGRASSIVLGGLMLATVLGVPFATIVDQNFGWQVSFWIVALLALACALAVMFLVPASRVSAGVSLREELASFRKGRLWAAYATSGLIIGATFAAFSYFSPIFTEISGFAPGAIPLLLAVYGAANVIGNIVVGRYADRYTFLILIGGLVLLAIGLSAFALFAWSPVLSVAAFIVIGFVGVPMNPAMVVRVMHAAHPGPLVNTVHTSVINIGLGFGAWAGGLGIEAGYGLVSPLWIGVGLALIGLLSLAPAGARRLDP